VVRFKLEYPGDVSLWIDFHQILEPNVSVSSGVGTGASLGIPEGAISGSVPVHPTTVAPSTA
jgi:hypothetical protein